MGDDEGGWPQRLVGSSGFGEGGGSEQKRTGMGIISIFVLTKSLNESQI